MDKWEKIKKAFDVIESGIADRMDLKDLNAVVYRAGTVIRIDFKGM